MPYTCGSCSTDLTQAVIQKQSEGGVMVLEAFIPGAPPSQPTFQSVTLRCTNTEICGRYNAFEIAARDANDPIPGRLLDKEEEEVYAQLRAYVTPKETGDRIQKYVAWIFGGAGTLSAVLGLSTSVIPFTLAGKLLLTLAVVFLALSMLASASASSLVVKELNPNNFKALLTNVVERRREQGARLKEAAWWFALALLIVGLIPVSNLLTQKWLQPQLQASYTYDAKSLTATATASGLEPLEPIELQVVTRQESAEVVAHGRATAGDDGKAQLSLSLERGDLARPLALKTWRLRAGKKEEERTTPIEVPSPTATEDVSYSLENGKLRLAVTVAHLATPRAYVLEVSQEGPRAPSVLARTRVVLSSAAPTGELKIEKDVSLASGALSLIVAREQGTQLVSVFSEKLMDKGLAIPSQGVAEDSAGH